MATEGVRIFISHTGKDRPWAEWVRWHLEAAGYATELDTVDWPPGTNFIEAMHKAIARTNPMLVLLSAAYLDPDRFTAEEWTARLAQRRKDPTAKLIPLRVDNVSLHDGIWASINVPDLFALPPDEALRVLLDAVRQVFDPPLTGSASAAPPPFPGDPTAAVVDTGPRPPGSLPMVWNLGRRNPAFIGRDGMLNRLHDTLGTGRRAAVQALHGMGGVGKTQLALEYAHRFAGEYDLAWWIPAERPELIGDHLATLAATMGLVAAGAATPAAVDALRTRLRVTGRWLLVFDNADDRHDLVPWLPDGAGHLVITSRSPAWSGVAQPIDVDVFTREESMGLLHTHLPHLADHDADRLADALGDLPLAIGQTGDLLAETRLSVDVYLTELHAHAAELLRDGRPPVGYPAPLAATVTLATERLICNDPAAGQLLALCARLGPEPIPIDLFTARTDLLPEPLAEVARRPLAFARTVAQLSRYGLARTTDAGPLLHRLTQAVLRDTDTDAYTHRNTVEQLLIAARPADPDTTSWWPRWAQLLPHILATDPATTDHPDMRSTTQAAVWYLLVRGDARTALPLAEQLQTAWTRRQGADDVHTLNITHTLASTYTELGRYEQARLLYEDVLARSRRVRGADDPGTLAVAASFIFVLHAAGDHHQARELGEETLARCRRVLGNDHRHTLGAADNVAYQLRALGEYERARQMDEDTLARRRRVLGDDHHDTLTSASNLADDLRGLGEYERAREMEEDNLAHCRRVLGDDHPNSLHSASNLADDLRRLGEHEHAHRLDEDTLARRRRVLGDDHPHTRNSADKLADDLDPLSRHIEADQLQREVANRMPRTRIDP